MRGGRKGGGGEGGLGKRKDETWEGETRETQGTGGRAPGGWPFHPVVRSASVVSRHQKERRKGGGEVKETAGE